MWERSLTDLFHRVKQVLPEKQELVTFPPHKTVREALETTGRRTGPRRGLERGV